MQIRDIGGEFVLINRLNQIIPAAAEGLYEGMGDDAAVIRIDHRNNRYLLVTTDILVEQNHFLTTWSTPEQIGLKAVEVNVSDIAAMGGKPTFMFVSLVLTPDTSVEWIEGVYRGMAESCRRNKITVAGGDTTHGAVNTISITLLGEAAVDRLCLRSHARPGDLLAVTGTLGASAAGLLMLKQNLPVSPYLRTKHLTPYARLDAAEIIAPIAHAMIDVSDGLAAEVNHICDRSQVGARVWEKDIPLHPEVISVGKQLGIKPADFALNGGEDYELLFSIAPENIDPLNRTGIQYYLVGYITAKDEGCFLIKESGEQVPLKGGYDQFTSSLFMKVI